MAISCCLLLATRQREYRPGSATGRLMPRLPPAWLSSAAVFRALARNSGHKKGPARAGPLTFIERAKYRMRLCRHRALITRSPRAFHRLACQHGLEGIVSKRVDGRYEPDRRSWRKIKCLDREEFVVVGWSDPEGSRHRIGALLLGYYTPDGKLIYAGRCRDRNARAGA